MPVPLRFLFFLPCALLAACADLQPSSGFEAFDAGDPEETPALVRVGTEQTPDHIPSDGEPQPGDFGNSTPDDLPQFTTESE